jgi:putative FmdB family regulatory protein
VPTYDYQCEQGHQFEVFQSMKDEPLSECIECGSPARRLIGRGAGFLFKGDGFYITDYRSKDYKDKAKAETSKGKGKDKDEGKSDGGSKKSSDATSSSGSKSPASGKKDSSEGGSKSS